ncbi:hypothetical protein SBOR_3070 [Sclerotinia borealis F-4128]|uniref:Uncharacterized protein n=1 Tax=Sclerotinia borealis (strain F-4128) TaxID=1432307 RepID=W9CKN9_SCLBF|nr:hypothetical protein SBOR_3070 [Sclerotinia borealis F-4128]
MRQGCVLVQDRRKNKELLLFNSSIFLTFSRICTSLQSTTSTAAETLPNMPRQGRKKGNRDDAYKPGKDDDDIIDFDDDDVIEAKPTAKPTAKPANVTQPAKGIQKSPSKGTPRPQNVKGAPKGTLKGTARSSPKPSTTSAYKKPSPPPQTSTAAPSSTTIKTPSPSDPYFCCHQPLPLPSSFPLVLQPFYTFLVQSLSRKFHPPPLASVPPSTTYYRFSHLCLSTCTEVHRYFISLDPRNETEGVFVEGSEEMVLGKAGALDDGGGDGVGDGVGAPEVRRQDVMILSRNARCEDHMKEGFWYVLMRVQQIEEGRKDVAIVGTATVGEDMVPEGGKDADADKGVGEADLGDEMDHEIDLDLYT